MLAGTDTFQLTGNEDIYRARIDGSAATSTFSGDAIPGISIIETKNPLFFIVDSSGQPDFPKNVSLCAVFF